MIRVKVDDGQGASGAWARGIVKQDSWWCNMGAGDRAARRAETCEPGGQRDVSQMGRVEWGRYSRLSI